MRFEGTYTPVITPFHSDHAIDHEGFARMIEHLLAAGIHGIVLAGTTGECYAQTRDERVELMQGVQGARGLVGDRVPLVDEVGALRTEDGAHYAGAGATPVPTPS